MRNKSFLLNLFLLISFSALTQSFQRMNQAHGLTERWQTDTPYRKEPFLFSPYKPVYFLLSNWTNNPNFTPQSLNPVYSLPDTLSIPLQNKEFKFQISFKFMAAKGIFWGHGDLWAAYTQTSRWQLYNADLSRAFRETNYEPEFILNFATHYKILGFTGKVAGIAMNHQSNGRNIPLSRSWNRIVGHVGFQRNKTEILLKGWYRIPDAEDENPNAVDYIGKAELLLAHNWRGHQFSLQGRNNLSFDKNRGSIQLDWGIPIYGHLKGHVQVFHGYGESMIDYNHKQTTLGLGINLVNWM